MSKKVYIGESNLMDIKNAMASNNVSHSTFMSENTPPYEKDEFEIGGEGGNNDFFHVNEELSQDLIKFALEQRPDKYSTWAVVNPDAPGQIPFYAEKKSRAIEFKRWYGKGVIVNLSKYENLNETYGYSKTIDFSEVGKVEYQWDYFEDDYQEWLQEEGLQDSPEVKMEYIKDNVTFDVDFLDNQIYHVMGNEGGLFYDDLENVFGESMAERMLNDCIENGSGSFETYEMYENESYDINNPQELNDIAMKLLPHGEYYKNCRGFILTNGVIVYTEGEHNDVLMIPGINNKFQFVELGNIRILDHSIDIGAEPTYEQEEVLRQILREYDGEEVYLDIFHDGEDIGVVYHSADYRYVMGEIDRFYNEGIKPQGGYAYENKKSNQNTINENIETEVEASEVKLDSFKKNDTLAPRIWDGFDLNPRARLKLLDIADDFWDFVNITWVKRKGIHLTGSICNFNWSKFSDIDLHLVVDFSEIDERKDFVQEYFDAKKNEWNNEHSNLKIFGYPVELYVEDVNAETASGGLYDLEENDWIKKPSPNGIKSIGLDKYEIKNKSADLMTKIDDLYDAFKATNDDAELREIGRKAHKLRDKIKKMRKFGLDRGGESDSFNIIYKVLRRAGYMDMLWDLSSELYDKLNSIDEIKDDKTAGIILEYLESNHNLPLYKYFEWAKNATDEDKAKDLMYQCSDTAVKYLETRNACMCDDLAKLRIEFRKNNDVIYDEDFVDAFARGIAKNGLLRDLDFFMRYRGDFYELPSWMTMDFNRIVKNEWCIHFCYDAYSIAREGFKWGTDDIGRLALTGAGLKKPAEGYNFAFPIGERHIDRNTYGSINPVTRERGSQEAVIFQTSGVEVYHEGDEQNQVVFWGPNAKNFIPIKYDREVGDWCIYGNKGQVLKSGSPSEILNWVLENLPQYRKQIMVGKNGVNLKEEIVADGNPDHNPFQKRWKHEREVLKDYIVNYGEIMTSKENGKEYKVLYDTMLSSRLGINYCICIQWDSMTMEPGNVIYVRAFDKFTRRRFKPEFDTRGFDNIEGTADDLA